MISSLHSYKAGPEIHGPISSTNLSVASLQVVAGQNTAQPAVYDLLIDLSKAFPSWTLPKPLELHDVVLAYVLTNRGSTYSPLPYEGYAYTADQKEFIQLATTFSMYTCTLYLDNETPVPMGATFRIRAVIVKRPDEGKMDLSRYQDYQNLKADFNLPD